MTREEAKSLLPIITAFAEGKTILVKDKRLSDEEDSWNETDDCSFNIDKLEYRIKPSPKYRPFKDAEECWNEMQKHQPFGWVKEKDCGDYHQIRRIAEVSDSERHVSFSIDKGHYYGRQMFNGFAFVDGAPFGAKEGA